MSRCAAFKQIDLTRALRAMKAGGIVVARVEIEPNRIVIITNSTSAEVKTPLDEWLKSDAS